MKSNSTPKDTKTKEMSAEELNARIDKSEDDFKNGRYKTSEELLMKYGFGKK